MYDRQLKCLFLIDSGSDVSLIPARFQKDPLFCQQPYQFQLEAANQQPIKAYGTLTVTLRLGLTRSFEWPVIVADVPYGILGADFLATFHLVPDLSRRQLVDTLNLTSVSAHHRSSSGATVHEVHTTSIDPVMVPIFAEFPGLTRPLKKLQVPKRTTVHPIEIVGPDVHAKPRHL